MNNKTKTCKYVLLIIFGLLCLLFGLIIFSIGEINTSKAYADTSESQIVTLEWSANRTSQYGSAIADVSVTFDGKPDSVTIEIDGLDALSEESDAGTYILTAKSSDPTYVFSNPTTTYTIKPKEVIVVWDGIFESEYGSEIENVTATFDGINATVTGKPANNSDAKSYILTATTDNKNYTLINAIHTYTIEPKEVEVVWNGILESEYGSEIQNVTATFDGMNATITGKPNNGANVGSYILTAITDNGNYKLLNTTRLYTVKAATINIQEVTLIWSANRISEYGSAIADVSVTFDGKPDSVTIEIDGLDALSEESDAGAYILTAKSSDPTYVFSNPTTTYTIKPKEVAVVWNGIFESEYGSEIGTVIATIEGESKDVYVEIDGLEQLNYSSSVGTYILKAQVNNPNYKLINETAVYNVIDVTWKNQIANKNNTNIILGVVLAIVIFCGIVVIVTIFLKNKKAEKVHFDTANALRKSNEALKEKNDSLLRERRDSTFRKSLEPIKPSLPIESECTPTWQEIYMAAKDLESLSIPKDGEEQTGFEKYAGIAAKKIESGILAHGKIIPIVEGVTTFDPIYHIQANKENEPVSGNVILKVIKHGVTINGYVVIKAEVIR